jgi:hypothetical protein
MEEWKYGRQPLNAQRSTLNAFPVIGQPSTANRQRSTVNRLTLNAQRLTLNAFPVIGQRSTKKTVNSQPPTDLQSGNND